MRRLQERLCLGLAVLLLLSGFSVFVRLVLYQHGLPHLPAWVETPLYILILLANQIIGRLDLSQITPWWNLGTGAVYWLPGLVLLFVSHHLRARRIRDEMALK